MNPIKRKKNIFVIGCGRWGTFIAWYLDHIGHKVSLYGRKSSANMNQLMTYRCNDYLRLTDSIKLTTDISGIMLSDIVIVSVGSQALRGLMTQLKELGVKDKTFVLCMKGIEIETKKRLSEVASELLDKSNRIAVWLGPGHVQEFYRGVPNCMVIDSLSPETKDELVESFSSELIRFYYGNDLIGNEIGGAAKNVIGIAAGLLEGRDLSSLKGALMSRGTREIGRLITAMGGNEQTVYGLCHLGDYEATLFSPHSHNLAYGKSIALGTPYNKLAEGYYTVEALCRMGDESDVDLPICRAVHNIIYKNMDPMEEMKTLFERSLKDEFWT